MAWDPHLKFYNDNRTYVSEHPHHEGRHVR